MSSARARILVALLALSGGALAGPLSLRVLPRMDGLILELRSDSMSLSPGVRVEGYKLELETSFPMEAPAFDSTFWTGPITLTEDSTLLRVEMDSSLASLDYAISPDSTVMLVF